MTDQPDQPASPRPGVPVRHDNLAAPCSRAAFTRASLRLIGFFAAGLATDLRRHRHRHGYLGGKATSSPRFVDAGRASPPDRAIVVVSVVCRACRRFVTLGLRRIAGSRILAQPSVRAREMYVPPRSRSAPPPRSAAPHPANVLPRSSAFPPLGRRILIEPPVFLGLACRRRRRPGAACFRQRPQLHVPGALVALARVCSSPSCSRPNMFSTRCAIFRSAPARVALKETDADNRNNKQQ